MRRDSSEFQSKNPMHHLILLKTMLMANFTYHLKHISALGYQNQIKKHVVALLWQSCNALYLNSWAFRFSLPKVQYRINTITKSSSCYWKQCTKKYEWHSQIMLEYTFTVKDIFFSGQWFKLKILCFKYKFTNTDI